MQTEPRTTEGDQHVRTAPATHAGPMTSAPTRPWPVFAVASITVFLVSLDGTVLFAAFGAF